MEEKTIDAKQAADAALSDDEKLAALIGALSEGSRRERQQAAHVVALIAKNNAEALVPHTAALADALNRPEAQTRWEALEALAALVSLDSRACDKAVAGAETALFDEDSGPLRLAAMRFLCRLGATTETRSERTWPLIDESIQCYHGDLEFTDMLIAVTEFSEGKLSAKVKQELAARMRFDAENSKGALKKRAAQIVENVSR